MLTLTTLGETPQPVQNSEYLFVTLDFLVGKSSYLHSTFLFLHFFQRFFFFLMIKHKKGSSTTIHLYLETFIQSYIPPKIPFLLQLPRI